MLHSQSQEEKEEEIEREREREEGKRCSELSSISTFVVVRAALLNLKSSIEQAGVRRKILKSVIITYCTYDYPADLRHLAFSVLVSYL